MEELPRDFEMPTKDPDKTDETDHVSYQVEGGFKAPIRDYELVQSVMYYGNGDPVEIKIPTKCPAIPEKCQHKWKTVAMISSYVTYCELCGEKK